MSASASSPRASFRAQVLALFATALVAFGILGALHVQQRKVRRAASEQLTAFRTARLDVAVGFAHVLGADLVDSPFDRAQGRALLQQGLEHLGPRSLPIAAAEAAELERARDEVRVALAGLRPDGRKAAPMVALRVAVGRLEAVAGRVDANAELDLRRSQAHQDDLFALSLLASTLLLGVVFTLLRRTSRTAEAAEAARDQAEMARVESRERERETQELLRSVADGATDAIFVKDAEGRYRFLNEAALRIFGRAPEDVIGRDDTSLWDEKSARTVLDHDAIVLGGVPSTKEEELLVSGVPRVFSATKVPRLAPDGRVVGLIGISRDVTEQRRLEERLRQAQKMEAIGRLAGGVAHDFNNLLTVINAYAELLLEDLPEGAEDARSTLGEIRDAGRRATDLTSQLLAFSRRAIVEPRTFELNDAIARSERLIRRLVGEDVVLSTSLEASPSIVHMDPTSLDQLLMNLCVNARDAMPRGGTLEIATTAVEAQADRPARFVELRVSDSGEGMPPEVLARVFEPFFTTKELGKGTGLGLSVVDGIVAQAGGRLEVESEVGRGTSFRIRLPSGEEPSATPGPGTERPRRDGRETILLVEDDQAVRALARRGLESCGYRILDASGGDEALAAAAALEGPLDLLVTDVVMPRMSGRELADRLREARPSLPVLFVSGYTDDAILRHGVAVGRDPLLAKPFTVASLSRKVREVLDGREAPRPSAPPPA